MHDPSRDRPVHANVGVDPAKPGAERTAFRIVRPDAEQLSGSHPAAVRPPNARQTPAAQRLAERWDADPVAFASDLGVHLNAEEQRTLRESMRGGVSRGGRHQRRVLERVRKKIERGLQRANEKSSAAPAGPVAAPAPLEAAGGDES